jgi:hypothetical protein
VDLVGKEIQRVEKRQMIQVHLVHRHCMRR